MDRLVNDIYVRRGAQVILGAFLFILIVIAFALLNEMAAKIGGHPNEGGGHDVFIRILLFPYTESFAPFIVPLAGLVPIVFSTVCYEIDNSKAPPVPKDTLNPIGRIALALLLVGAGGDTIDLIVLGVWKGDITQMLGGANYSNVQAVQGLVGGILSFQLIYFVQLMGMKK